MNGIEAYAAPRTLEEAVRLLSYGGATPMAGGTDIMPQAQSGRRCIGPLLLSLRRISELKGITQENGSICIGALTTVTEILDNDLLRETAPILPDTADCFASSQVRNSATVGGNICNASPAGDLIIPLLLLDAQVDLIRWSGGRADTRSLPLCDFFLGPGQTRLQPDELLASIAFPIPSTHHVAGFRKFGKRPALDIAIVSVGIACNKENGILRNVRVALGAVAPIPLRGRQTEALVEGTHPDDEALAAAARTAQAEISPISDVRASAWYRRELIGVLTERLLRDVC